MPELTYGVIAGGEGLKAWQLACVQELERSGLARLRAVIHRKTGEPATPYQRLCGTPHLPALSKIPLTELTQRAGILTDTPLDALQLDFFLLFGEPHLGDEFRTTARYGVWYFAHGDFTQFVSDAPGFWELYHHHDVTGAALLRLNEAPLAGTLLKSGYLPTVRTSFTDNLENILALLPKWPAQVCSDIAQSAARYFDDAPVAQPPRFYTEPNHLQILRLRLLEVQFRIRRHVRNQLFTIDWHVGRLNGVASDYIDQDRSADIAMLFPNPKGVYLADPCLMQHNGETAVFCEAYYYGEEKGTIVAANFSDASALQTHPAIESPHHISYPQVFEYNSAVYCIPESGSAKKVSLYRSVEFPYKWELASTLIENFSATDPTLLRIDGTWWLFCTSDELAHRGYNSCLYLWYANDLFGPWNPHPKNPVKIDARSARPAGALFMHNNLLYRPAQNCSRIYGGEIHLNRITTLTPTDFKEVPAGIIRPPKWPYNKGIHTISSAGDLCLVDAKRYLFKPTGIIYELRWLVKSVAVRLGVPPATIEALAKRLRKSPSPP